MNLARSGVLLVACLAACGGKLVETVQDLHFDPQQRSAGYGYVGGMHVTLVDPTSDHVKRTIQIAATELSGSFDVASGGATVTLVEIDAHGTTLAYPVVSGTVSIDSVPGGSGFGRERVHVDLLFTDLSDPTRELHVSGTFDAPLDYIG